MRLNTAAEEDRPWRAEEAWIPAAPAPAVPGKRPRAGTLVGEPPVAEEPGPPPDDERRPRGKAGAGSFMPPVRELMLAGEEPAEKKDPAPEKKEKRKAKEETKDATEEKKDATEVDPMEMPEAEALEEESDQAPEADDGEELDGDLEVGEEIAHVALLSPHLAAAGGPPDQLDAVAVEAELDSAIGAVEEPDGPDGARVRLTRVAEIAGARRRTAQAAIDGESAELDVEEEAVGRRGSDRREEGATLLAGTRKRKLDAAQSSHAGRLLTRATSRDELKQQLLTAQTDEKSRAADMLSARLVDLETRLAGQMALLMEEQKIQEAAITAELALQNAALATRIENKRKAHEEQIAREKVALELQAETEKVTARAEAAGQAGDVVASADAQAAYTLTEAQLHAGNVEAKATDEAALARHEGEVKAQQAIDAAQDRASSAAADESEEASILDEGERRANLARAQASWRAIEITCKGTVEAGGIRDKGKADSTAEKERGQRESAAALERGEAAVERIEDELAAGIATMKLQSTMAVAEMENERALAMLELEQAHALALTRMATELTLACVKIEQERTAAVIALRTEHDTLVATIDLEVATSLAKVDAASDKDLARLQRRVERDLAAIERQVKQAERRMQSQVERAEARAMADVARRRGEIRKAGGAVLRAIDGAVAKAERAIDKADEDTSQEISDAALLGVQAIGAEAEQAREDNRTASETAIREQESAAQAARSETSDLATTASQEMEDDRKELDGDIDEQWVDDALARSGELLATDGLDWAVTDGDSVEAMHLLASLPPHLQGQAIDSLDGEQFATLLSEMDEERHEHLESLVDASTDPDRKLELWQHFQLSKANQDAERNGDEWSQAIAAKTAAEIAEEVALLESKRQDGTLTAQEVSDLVARKKLENQIEMEFRVNIANEKDKPDTAADERFRAASGPNPGTRIAWDVAELTELAAALDDLPDAHVQGNSELREFRREDVKHDRLGNPQPDVGGSHGDGVIRIFDKVNDPTATFRHGGDPREHGEHADHVTGANLSVMEVVVAHELGHNIHDQNPILWAAFQAAGGWETDLSEQELLLRGLTPQQIAQMKTNQQSFPVGDKEYGYRYGEFNAYDVDRLPATGHDPAHGNQPRDTWRYARDNYKDHFAETYMKAVLVPEQLAVDMLDQPERRLEVETIQRDMAEAARDSAKANLAALQAVSPPPPLPDVLAALNHWNACEANLASSEAGVAEAEESQMGLAAQYTIMRDGIFQTGKAVAAAEAELVAGGVDEAKVADFVAKAARLSTPDQVEELKKSYV